MGDADEYCTLAQVERTISQINGNATSCIIPNAGHTPHKELPEDILIKLTHYVQHLIK